jgi:molecular chaperone HscA
MGLLSIQEPDGKSSHPNQPPKIALGIDLGTTHSLVGAYLDNEVVLFKNAVGQVLLPSVVLYLTDQNKEQILVGQQAIDAEKKHNTQKAIYSVKRFMGKAIEELGAKPLPSGTALQADEQNLAMLSTAQGMKSPIQISADILKKLVEIAKLNLAKNHINLELNELVDAVITVPAYFDDGQRQATKAAAELAGINVLRLLNEPTAAALAYGYDKEESGTYLVYDLGGGTFDVSILRFQKGIFEVLATSGDTALGGDDMDACIIDYLKQFSAVGEPPICWRKAREIKEALTERSKIEVVLDNNSAQDKKISLSCYQFDKLIKHLIDKTIYITQHCIQDAKIALQDIHKIILVGGATRVPAISKALSIAFGLPISQELDPDKIVAMGATLQAAKLMGQTDTVLLDVVPLSLGIELMGGVTEKIIVRNSKLPISVTQTYTTYQDNQTGFKIQVVQGERELVKDNRSLASFELTGLPALPQGKLRIAMTFTVDVDGLLTVTAKETTTNQFHQVEVKPTYGLTRVDIDAAILKAAEYAKTDVAERQLIEAKREATKLITFARSILTAINMQSEALVNIEKSLAILLQAMEQQDTKAIKSATKQLEDLLAPVSLSYLSEVLSV